MDAQGKKTRVKVGQDDYLWQYNEARELLEIWNSDNKRICKEKVGKKDFEELSVAAFIKRNIDK